ncbi:hypothetical protein [Nitratifractor sp.]|uniref:hypothetical protein n=1 Tax=Nitratifractor sp. TaxID=2268144 RepID=UPI0025D8873D|nr:hypothetical protein [Nitratifractor sp.]
MIYLYAYTNHRADLEALRRMGALWRVLEARGVRAELIVNDYRAQLAGRELGLPPATTVENIMELDALANGGDRVVIDSPEDPGERLGFYVEKYAGVYTVKPCGAESRFGETVLAAFGEGVVVDLVYEAAASLPKIPRKVFIYGDTDHDKRLLNAAEDLGALGLDLYWGSYFYVKYEEELARCFGTIYESEEYRELIEGSETVVTAMPQTAAEAIVAGAKTIWLDRGGAPVCATDILEAAGAVRIPWGDWSRLETVLNEEAKRSTLTNLVGDWAGMIAD